MTKICFTPLLTRTQGCQGCQKIQTTKLMSLVSWSAKIQPKLKKLWKTVKIELKWSKKPCFLHFIELGLNLSTSTYQSGLQFGLPDFWHHWRPWGMSIEEISLFEDVFLIFLYHWAIWWFFHSFQIETRYHLYWYNWPYYFLVPQWLNL